MTLILWLGPQSIISDDDDLLPGVRALLYRQNRLSYRPQTRRAIFSVFDLARGDHWWDVPIEGLAILHSGSTIVKLDDRWGATRECIRQ